MFNYISQNQLVLWYYNELKYCFEKMTLYFLDSLPLAWKCGLKDSKSAEKFVKI